MQNKIDIVNEYNQPTGQTVSINEALAVGGWHRGAHIVICTKTGYVLLQKRSKRMVTHPGLLDFSVGGFVDTRETPEEAAIREVREEVGIRLSHDDLHFLRIHRYNHYWPKLRKKNRAFIYLYVVCLPDHYVRTASQQEEVEWAKFVPLSEVQRLVRHHHLKGLGRLEPTYGFYTELLADAQKVVQTTTLSSRHSRNRVPTPAIATD